MALSIEHEKEKENNSMDCEFGANGSLKIQKVESIKPEPEDEEIVIQEMLMEEVPENKDIQRIKENPSRRRSLRNEQASVKKIKPAKYDEIFNCYKRKEFKECMIYIDLVADSTKDCIEYQILKATCLINLLIKLPEAHRILDEILKKQPDNPYCTYAKGLACYQECRWQDSIKFFEKAIALDPQGMEKAEVLKGLAESELENDHSDDESSDEQMEVENVKEEDSQDSIEIPTDSHKRFGCDLCGKRFGKKFNLDRHNKALHNRTTPFIPPLQRTNRKSATAKTNEIKIKEEVFENEIVEEISINPAKSTQLKISLFGKSKKKRGKKAESQTLPNGMARCNICRKVYSRGSLARHQIIHTGQKSFECTHCGKAFYQKSDLQRHETIHSDVFEYECKICDKMFRIKKNLQVHNKRHHSN